MAELAPGTEFAGCRIDGVAGRGGMGVVYRATELHLQRPVAVKLIAATHAADEEFRERFDREARLAASIDHPNVLPVYGAGEEDGRPYLVMRLVQGIDLHDELRGRGPLSPARAAAVVGQVAAALDAAHAAGLVHRDVKPANVLLDGATHVYLTDFGLTRLAGSDTRITETGRWLGTVDFASPEQLAGGRCDARSDVYALGCVLHAALTGEPPFSGGTVPAVMHAHLHDPPPKVSDRGAPAAFDPVIARALAKDPAGRYPSAGDLGRAALAAASGDRVTEEERTVAVGPAAPESTPTVVLPDAGSSGGLWARGVATAADAGVRGGGDGERGSARGDGPPTAETSAIPPPRPRPRGPETPATAAARAAAGAQPQPPPPAVTHKPGRRRSLMKLGAAAVAGLGLVAVLAVAGAGGSGPPPAVEAVSEDEVRDAAERFASAYSEEDVAALRRLVTADVVRVLPGSTQRGRASVVKQYADQFGDMAVKSYDMSDLDIVGGDSGRAAGTYTVRRKRGAPFGGTFVLGVVKERGRVRVRLIAATPA